MIGIVKTPMHRRLRRTFTGSSLDDRAARRVVGAAGREITTRGTGMESHRREIYWLNTKVRERLEKKRNGRKGNGKK